MELKEFVKSVLIDLDEAIEEARSEMKRDVSFQGTNSQRVIEFDIAVAVESTNSKGVGGGIKVLELIKAEGKTNSESKNSTVSRIKFGIEIEKMTKKEQDEHTRAWQAHNASQEFDDGL